jgi:CDP-4-dehydro-6-deoxyglucose reductase
MTYQITIQPSGHQYPVENDESVLQAALDAGYTLPHGCRNGACGSCKGKVIEGCVDHGATPEKTLSEEERAAGMALFCCAKPLSDLVIECREVPAQQAYPVKTLPCRVQKIERLAPDVIALHLKLPNNEPLAFRAGQYVEILLKDGQRRAFSIANAPHEEGLLQLHIRLVPDGQFTTHVFNTMKEREILRFEGPHGSFYLREDSDKPIIFVAGGTGFAPIRSIIEHVIHAGISRPMTLYWGAKDRAGLYLAALPERWAAQQANFKYVPVLSEPSEADAWTARRGFVHCAVLEDFPDLSGHQVYICGAPPMIDAARRDFLAQGLPEEEFFADVFSFASHPA